MFVMAIPDNFTQGNLIILTLLCVSDNPSVCTYTLHKCACDVLSNSSYLEYFSNYGH